MNNVNELKALEEINNVVHELWDDSLSGDLKEYLDTFLEGALKLPLDDDGNIVLTHDFRTNVLNKRDNFKEELKSNRTKDFTKLSVKEINKRINSLLIKAHGKQ